MQKVNVKHCYVICLLLATAGLHAQEDAESIYEGNKMYHSGKIIESTGKYSRALQLNPNNRKANFNLGNAFYRNAELIKSGKMQIPPGNKITPDSLSKLMFEKAAENYAIVANSVSNKDTLHRAWHNIGNCYLKKKEYQQAVDAYKKALKMDPKDEETRYNLAYALKNLPKQQKKGGGGQQQQQQQQDKKDNKNDKGNPQQQNRMSKEQAEQLLKALMDSEKKLQDKRKQRPDESSRNVEKDW